MMFASPRGPLGATLPLTLSGNEITDGVRAAALQGDGRSPDGSMGIWEATTNLVLNGGFETNTTNSSAVNGTRARITTDYKFGAACCQVTPGGVSSCTLQWDDYAGASASQVYTFSVWVKGSPGATQSLVIGMEYRDAGGTYLGQSVAAIGVPTTTWTRYTVTGTTLASTAKVRPKVNQNAASSEVFYADGAQLELHPLATPYVETNGATASRSQAGVQAPASLIDETQGWIAARIRYPWAAASVNTAPTGAPRVFNWGNYKSDFLALAVENIAGAKFTLSRHATVDTNRCNVAATFAAGDTVTVIAAWTSTTLKLSVNGAAFTSQAQADIPVIPETLFYIGRDITSAQTGDEEFFWVACGLGTLTDADAAAIHANGNPEPPPGLFPDAADLRMIWKPRNSIARQFYG